MEIQFDEIKMIYASTALIDKVCCLKRLFMKSNLHWSNRFSFMVWYKFRWDEIILIKQKNWIAWLNALMWTHFNEKTKTILPNWETKKVQKFKGMFPFLNSRLQVWSVSPRIISNQQLALWKSSYIPKPKEK